MRKCIVQLYLRTQARQPPRQGLDKRERQAARRFRRLLAEGNRSGFEHLAADFVHPRAMRKIAHFQSVGPACGFTMGTCLSRASGLAELQESTDASWAIWEKIHYQELDA
jgi:hypothetical protein